MGPSPIGYLPHMGTSPIGAAGVTDGIGIYELLLLSELMGSTSQLSVFTGYLHRVPNRAFPNQASPFLIKPSPS